MIGRRHGTGGHKKHVDLGIDMLELGNDPGIVRATWDRATTAVAEITAASGT